MTDRKRTNKTKKRSQQVIITVSTMGNLKTIREEIQEVREEIQEVMEEPQEGVGEEEEMMDQDGNLHLHQILERKKEGEKEKRRKDLEDKEETEIHPRITTPPLRPHPPRTLAARLIS